MSSLKKVLSIDGGGIRGIIPGQILVEIESEFGVQVARDFDLVAGTSTGGILACAYLMPKSPGSAERKFSAQEVVDLYFDRGDEIFDIPIFHKIRSVGGLLDEKYPEDGIEEALHDYFRDTWLKDLMKPCIITSYDIRRRKGHFFGQHKASNPEYNFKVKDVARATSAAPTYFECAKVTSEHGDDYPLIDGGVFVNNPALVAYAEGRNLFDMGDGKMATAKDMKIFSISTGHTRKKYYYSKAKNWGMAEWVQPIIDIMMSGGSEVAHYQLDMIYDAIGKPNQYFRIDGDLKKTSIDADMDCATQENMEKLKQFGKDLFDENKERIKEWLEI